MKEGEREGGRDCYLTCNTHCDRVGSGEHFTIKAASGTNCPRVHVHLKPTYPRAHRGVRGDTHDGIPEQPVLIGIIIHCRHLTIRKSDMLTPNCLLYSGTIDMSTPETLPPLWHYLTHLDLNADWSTGLTCVTMLLDGMSSGIVALYCVSGNWGLMSFWSYEWVQGGGGGGTRVWKGEVPY